MLILVLRLLHIGSGVFWVGAFLTFFQFVQPAAMAVAPTATGFTYRLLHHRRFSFWMLGSAITTVIAGLWLLGITSDGYNLSVMFETSHLGFTIGGLAAIITLGRWRPVRVPAHARRGADDRRVPFSTTAAEPRGAAAAGARGARDARRELDRPDRADRGGPVHGHRSLLAAGVLSRLPRHSVDLRRTVEG